MSLQNLSNAIKNRKKISESNNSPVNNSQRSKSLLLRSVSNVSHLVKKLCEIGSMEVNKRNVTTNGTKDDLKVTTQTCEQATNVDTTDKDKQHEDEISVLKAKFLRHKEILKSNYEQAENEVIRLDEIYHDTVDMVLKAFNSIPDVVNSSEELLKLKESLKLAMLEAQQEALSIQPVLDQKKLQLDENKEDNTQRDDFDLATAI